MRIGLLFLLITFSLSAQQWINMNPRFSENPINLIKFKDENTGYIALGSALWKTTDKGNTLFQIDDPGSLGYNDIYFFGDTIIAFCPTRILKSTNNGITFDSVGLQFGTTFRNTKSFFLNPLWGVVITNNINGVFKKTTDGGLNWSTLSIPVYASGIYFSDSSHGVLITNLNGTYQTSDGGSTWNSLALGVSNYGLLFYYGNHVIIKSYAGFFISTNKGITWTKRVLNPYGNAMIIKDDFMILYQTYKNKFFLISYDKGVSWQYLVNSIRYPSGMEAINDSVFYTGSVKGSLYKSSDKGKNWECLTRTAFDLSGLSYVDEKNIFAAGENFMRTSDGGNTWEVLYTKPGIFGQIYFINTTTGFAEFHDYSYSAGSFGNFTSFQFLKTTNRGNTWDTLYSVVDNFNLHTSKFYFKDNNNGYVIGNGIYFTTTDRGNSWDFTNPQNLSGNDINFLNSERGYLTYGQTGYFTTDGGTSWIEKSNFTGQTILFVDSLTGFLGYMWALRKTTDGGNTFFDLINHGQEDSFSDLTFWGKDTGVVHFHHHELIIKTTDGGANWNTIFSWQGYPDYFQMKFITPLSAWVVGSTGGIYKYTDQLIPVELLSFTAEVVEKTVKLNWSTSTEINNKGFIIKRKVLSEDWREIVFIPGAGTTSEKTTYSFTDNLSVSGKYYYKLIQVDLEGTIKNEKEVEVNLDVPQAFILYQNYPNPFNPITKIKYALPYESSTQITIYNIIGEVIRTIAINNDKAGIHEFSFDASGLASGIYSYRITSGNYSATKKMLLLK